jgi:hypothetical protein
LPSDVRMLKLDGSCSREYVMVAVGSNLPAVVLGPPVVPLDPLLDFELLLEHALAITTTVKPTPMSQRAGAMRRIRRSPFVF